MRQLPLCLSLFALGAGLSLTSAPAFGQDAPAIDEASLGDCDPLVPSYCNFPFPSSFYLRSDATRDSGQRVELGPKALPAPRRGDNPSSAEWSSLDGFSPIPQIMAHFPGLDPSNLPSHRDMNESVAAGSPTMLLDATTGELVHHWAELDSNTANEDRRTFLMYPAARLKGGHRYIVAMRDLKDDFGTDLPASPAFAALRDGGSFDDPSIEGRRARFESIFEDIEDAGWDRSELTLAWDFTTASDDSLHRRMLHMREDAFARMPAGGPNFRDMQVQDDYNDEIYRKVTGWMKVPHYMDALKGYSNLVLDENDLPVFQGWTWTRFTILIPRSIVENGTQGRLVQYGHGLYGSQGEVESGYLRQQANENGYILFATDWWGMQWLDVPATLRILKGNMEDFPTVPDRLHQGFINKLYLMRMMMTRMSRSDLTMPMGIPTIDTERRSYYGNSQGGIFGGTYMTLSQDVERGCVGVHGASYSIMLWRSKDFDFYEAVLRGSYPDPMDVANILALMQMVWDRTDPAGWVHRLSDNPLEDTPSHRIIQQVALEDHQVHNISSRVFSRSIPGSFAVAPVTTDVWGLEKRFDPSMTGSGYYEWDFGMPLGPVENIPPFEGDDTHESARRAATAQQQMYHFFETGEIKHFCDGPCDPD